MIDNAGYLYPEKRDKGRERSRVPIAINCCGSKRFFTRDYLRRRPDGRLDYQLLYVYRGTGHYLFSDGWKAMERRISDSLPPRRTSRILLLRGGDTGNLLDSFYRVGG